MEPRPDPRLARSRARVLAAATELLVETGPQGLTVDAIAERSGVAKSTLYRHWRSQTDLLVDVMRSNMPPIATPDVQLGFEASLRTMVRGIAEAFAAPDWARIFPGLMALRRHQPEIAALVDSDHEAKLAVLAQVIELGVAEGRLARPVDTYRAVQLLVGPLIFAVLDDAIDQLPDLAEDVVDRFIASS